MDVLVVYDIDTTTTAGEQRLRLIARICEGFGQRIQKSVFEMVLSDTQYVRLTAALRDAAHSSDNIRIYPLPRNSLQHVIAFGRNDLPPQGRQPWIF